MLEKFSAEAQKYISLAESLAFDFGSREISPCYLLLSFLKDDALPLTKELKKKGLDEAYVTKKIKLRVKKNEKVLFMEYQADFKRILQKAIEFSKDGQENKISISTLQLSFLLNQDTFCANLFNEKHINSYEIANLFVHKTNRKSELEKISDLHDLSKDPAEPYVERKQDFQKLYIALKRRNKPNALLVGAPGVGKTAMVRELAHRIKRGEIPGLEGKRIYELDLASVVGGTKYRGEFEEKLKKIIQKVMEDKNAILFIDEIHNIIRAGGAEGAIDASNILKPYLSRGAIQIIGATTDDEYYQVFLKDKALSRRFQVIFMNPASKEETKSILRSFLPVFADFYHINMDESLLDYIIDVADSYLPTLSFPDKAIDILDNSCVLSKDDLSKEAIDEVVENYYHISLKKKETAKQLKEDLQKNVIGQEAAIEAIYEIFQSIDEQIYHRERPMLSLLLRGPSGVGKTKIAKIISHHYYDENEFFYLDLSFYHDSSSLYRLIGYPEEKEHTTGIFTRFLKEHPHCFLLLENIDKASPEVIHFFSHLVNQGFFYDHFRHKIDAHHAMFVFTATVVESHTSFALFKEHADSSEDTRLLPDFFLQSIDEIVPLKHLTEEAFDEETLQKIQSHFLPKDELSSLKKNDISYDKNALQQYGFHYMDKEVGKQIKQWKKIKEIIK